MEFPRTVSRIRRKAVWGSSIVTALVLCLATTAAAGQNRREHKFDEAVRKKVNAGESARVIMKFDTARQRDDAFRRLLDRGAAVRTIDTEDGPALNVLSSAALMASESDQATQVSLDAPVFVNAVKGSARAKAAQRKTPARDAKVQRASKQPRGRKASLFTVAVIDSGIQPQEDLEAYRIIKSVDFVTGSSKSVDFCGHGTHVAGTIAGSGAASGGDYAGVDPSVDLVSLRVLGDDCSGNTSDVIDALEWVAKNYRKFGIKVVNLSLGHPVFESVATDPMVQAVERLSRKGIVVVTAAGNMGINPTTHEPGYGGVGVPCNAPSAVCVGALDTKGTAALNDDTVAPFSSRGPTRFDLLAKPDLVARGVGVVSVAAKGSKLDGNKKNQVKGKYQGRRDAPAYLKLSGTSMAAPQVAGTAALMLSANRTLSANAVKLALQYTAKVLPGIDTLVQGAGALNQQGAVLMAQLMNPAAPVGEPWVAAELPRSNLDQNGKTVKWGRRIIWGDRFMPRDAASVHMARWDDNIVWGFDTLAENIVWGNSADDENIVWGNNIVWGDYFDEDNIVWGNVWDDNIVWGENIVWDDDNIVWGFDDDNIVWGNNSCNPGKQ